MKILSLNKKSGGKRIIAVPDSNMRSKCASWRALLNQAVVRHCDPDVVHGFMFGKSPVTNAQRHVGYKYTVSMDIENFFHSITPKHLSNLGINEIINDLMVTLPDGTETPCVQGLPTSPALANLAGSKFDKVIVRAFKKRKWDICYTRYADDLTFSYNDDAIDHKVLIKTISEIISRNGFRIAERKTQYMPASFGRRKICGVAVDDKIHPSREARRKLRAAKHQMANGNSVNGLSEWCKLKEPKQSKPNTFLTRKEQERTYALFRKHYKFLRKKVFSAPEETIEFRMALDEDRDFIITRDIAYLVGMSTYTTNWRSCVGLERGSYRSRVNGWISHPYTYVAAIVGKQTAVVAKVERRTMESRALVHICEDGQLVYNRQYGESSDAKDELKRMLEAFGISELLSPPQFDLTTSYQEVILKGSLMRKPYIDRGRWDPSTSTITGSIIKKH